MRTDAEHRSLLEHEDDIRAPYARNPLRDEDRRRIRIMRAQGLAQGRVRPIVQRAAGIVQNQDLGIARQRAGDEQALALPAGQIRPLRRQLMGIAVLKGLDERGRLRAFRRALDLLAGKSASQIDVLLDRVREERVALKRHAEHAMQLALRDAANVAPADADVPLVHRIKALQQLHERRLAAARRPHDAERLAAPQRKTDVRQGLALTAVGKAHVLKADMIVRRDHVLRGRLFLLRRVQHLLNARGGGAGLRIEHEHAVDREQGVEDDRKVRQKRDDLAGFRAALLHQKRARDDDAGQAQVQQEVHQRVRRSHDRGGVRLLFRHLRVDAAEASLFVFRAGKRLDDPDACHVVAHDAHHAVPRLPQLAVKRNALAGDENDAHGEQRQG